DGWTAERTGPERPWRVACRPTSPIGTDGTKASGIPAIRYNRGNGQGTGLKTRGYNNERRTVSVVAADPAVGGRRVHRERPDLGRAAMAHERLAQAAGRGGGATGAQGSAARRLHDAARGQRERAPESRMAAEVPRGAGRDVDGAAARLDGDGQAVRAVDHLLHRDLAARRVRRRRRPAPRHGIPEGVPGHRHDRVPRLLRRGRG